MSKARSDASPFAKLALAAVTGPTTAILWTMTEIPSLLLPIADERDFLERI
jgi:hypothetical protein